MQVIKVQLPLQHETKYSLLYKAGSVHISCVCHYYYHHHFSVIIVIIVVVIVYRMLTPASLFTAGDQHCHDYPKFQPAAAPTAS